QEAGFCAADIRSGSAMQVELEIPAGPAGIFADQAGVVRLVNRSLQAFCLIIKFATNINVAGADPHPDRSEQASFDQLVRVVAYDVAVLAGARLTLVGIDAKIGRAIALLWHERPLQDGRETGAATTAQPGILDLFNDPIAPF